MGRPVVDLTGQKFGRITVICRAPRKNNTDPAKWVCECNCGNIKNVRGPNLVNNLTKSCGCIVKENAIKNWKIQAEKHKKLPGYSSSKRTYGIKKRTSIIRGLAFDLTLDDFLKLVVTECYYCGDEPSHISNFKKLNGQFVYHGIDRVDNNIGYTLENSVSSCWPCNRAKSTMTTSEFLIMIKKIHDKHIK